MDSEETKGMEYKDSKETEVYKDFKEIKVHKDFKETMVFKVKLE